MLTGGQLFADQVERYARKDSKQFEAVISITVWMETNGFVWMETNGFDSYVFYKFSLHQSDIPEVSALKGAFDERFNEMMTTLMRGKLPPDTDLVTPRRPITFSAEGVDFHWAPPSNPLPWARETTEG